MQQALSRFANRFLPQGWSDLGRQIVLFCGAYYLYRIVRGLVDGRAQQAFANAQELIDIERTLGIFVEPGVHAWAASKSWVIDFSSWAYVNSHFTITVVTLAWLYLFRNPGFYWIRNMFMVAMGVALLLYVLYPTAPPRFMPEWGFSDSVAEFTGITASDSANLLYNPFAAVPSMHVAFALMLGIPLAKIVKRRPIKLLWTIYPLIVSFVVVATANHWTADAVLGAVTAGIGAAGAAALARLRPEVWSWTTAPSSRPRKSEAATGIAAA